jgi:hypothetical protein
VVRSRRSSRKPLVVETPIAVRAYTIPVRRKWQSDHRSDEPPTELEPWRWPNVEVAFDTETRTDATQRLTFGWYQIRRRGKLFREGPITADDLSADESRLVASYIDSHRADDGRRLYPLTRAEFADLLLWGYGYEARALLVGFNLPFDLSRLAIGAHRARGGGYALRYWRRSKDPHDERAHKFRPDVNIHAIDARRQFIRFTSPETIDPENLGPDGKPFRGNFLDLHTLAYAFSDKNLSLDSAAETFGCRERKQTADVEYGVVDEHHIDYCRQDVRVTTDLLDRLHDEYDRHPIGDILPATQLVSPASLGKAYLRAMGITPLTERGGSVPRENLGQAMTAYTAGRVETMVRRVDLACVYVDATSMYSSVFGLTKLWRTITAAELNVVDATADASAYLAAATRDRLLDPAAWPALAGVFCRVRPSGHLLPVRAQFRTTGTAREDVADGPFQIALSPLDSDGRDLWYALADLVACRLLTGDSPDVIEAFRVEPSVAQVEMRSIRLRGELEIDPTGEDFFQRIIEARMRVDTSTDEGKRLKLFLKTMASSAAYGIFAEVRELPKVGGRGATVDVWARRYFQAAGIHRPEEPGRYCYPPVAATVTACARLLLAVFEVEVHAAGGRHIAADTDALIVVASESGGLVPCPGGDELLADGTAAIQALSWAEVDAIRERLNALNPYDRDAVKDLFKLEDENFGKATRERIELRCVAISPKRYSLFEVGLRGETIVRRASQHGLGYFLPPAARPRLDSDEEETKVGWTELIWRRIIDEIRGRDSSDEPTWFDSLAPSRAAITSWDALEPYRRLNERRRYPNRIKPANFLIVAHDDPLVALPSGFDRARLTPIAPFSRDPLEWPGLPWRNRFDGEPLRLTTKPDAEPGRIRVRTYRDVVVDHRLHPDPKAMAADGGHVQRGTSGVVGRLPVRATAIRYIGKETARLDEEESGLLRLAGEPFTAYEDRGDEWAVVRDQLRRFRDNGSVTVAEIGAAAGASRRTVQYWLNGTQVPRSPAVRDALGRLVRSHGLQTQPWRRVPPR